MGTLPWSAGEVRLAYAENGHCIPRRWGTETEPNPPVVIMRVHPTAFFGKIDKPVDDIRIELTSTSSPGYQFQSLHIVTFPERVALLEI